MKKLTLLATMFAALTFASCGGGKGEGSESDSTAVAADSSDAAEPVVEETPVDTAATADTAAVAE